MTTKKLFEHLRKRTNLKGSAIIESLLVIPFLIILVFAILQIFLYYYSNNVMNTATNDAANTASYQLRGHPSLVENIGNNSNSLESLALAEIVKETSVDRMDEVTKHNGFILYGKDKNGDQLDDLLSEVEFKGSKSKCDDLIKNKTRVTCAYLDQDDGGYGDNRARSYQLIVRTKAPYRLTGNFLSVLSGKNDGEPNIFVYGNASSPIDMPGRFNYFE